jgi:hypothetical protein
MIAQAQADIALLQRGPHARGQRLLSILAPCACKECSYASLKACAKSAIIRVFDADRQPDRRGRPPSLFPHRLCNDFIALLESI